MAGLIPPNESLIPEPQRTRSPGNRNAGHDIPRGWKGRGRRSPERPVLRHFHRNVEISSRYAWMYQLPGPLASKWAAMAAIAFAPHPARPVPRLRLDADRHWLRWTSRTACIVRNCC